MGQVIAYRIAAVLIVSSATVQARASQIAARPIVRLVTAPAVAYQPVQAVRTVSTAPASLIAETVSIVMAMVAYQTAPNASNAAAAAVSRNPITVIIAIITAHTAIKYREHTAEAKN
jgi:hypothetical protein